MKSKQKPGSGALECPIAIDYMDSDMVEEVVEEAFLKEPKKRRRKA
jgi:hypothetical protein